MTGAQDKAGDFWTRRKAAVREAEAAEEAERRRDEEISARQPSDARPDVEILEELNLPDPDELEEDDQFVAFLSAAVPERLRRRALRRLWAVKPHLANLDGLIDYGEDFTDSAMVVEQLQTAYQVGKGMLQHVMKQAESEQAPDDGNDRQASDDEDAGPADLDAGSGAAAETGRDELTDTIDLVQDDDRGTGGEFTLDEVESEDPGEQKTIEQPSRRMRFRYS